MLGPKRPRADVLIAAVESEMFGMENPGFCTACGEEAMECEPDARDCECESCEEPAVYGAEELMLIMTVA